MYRFISVRRGSKELKIDDLKQEPKPVKGGGRVVLPWPGRPIYLAYSRTRPTALAAGAGYGVRNFFNGPLSPKQPTKPNKTFLLFRIIRLK